MTKLRPGFTLLLVALVVASCVLLLWIGRAAPKSDERRELTTMIAVARQAMVGRDLVTDYSINVAGIESVEIEATLRDDTTGDEVAALLEDLAAGFSSAGVEDNGQSLRIQFEWTLNATAMSVTTRASSPEGNQGFSFAEDLRTRLTVATSMAGVATKATLDSESLLIDYGTVDQVPAQLSSLKDAESGFPAESRRGGVTEGGEPINGIGEVLNYQNWWIRCLNAWCGSASELEDFIAALPPSTGQSLWVFHDPYGGLQADGQTWTHISSLDPDGEPRDATLTQDNAGGFVAALDRLCTDPAPQRVDHGYLLTAGHAYYNSVTVAYLCTADGLQVFPDSNESELAEELLAAARQASEE